MTMNGQNINFDNMQSINFFKNLNIDELPDEEVILDEMTDNAKIREANESGNIPRRFFNCRINDFDYEFKSDIYDFIKNPQDHVLLLSSAVGCGKTTLLSSIMHERALLGLSAGVYITNLTLSAMLRAASSFTAKENEYELLQRLANVDFLAIDEYGVDPNLEEESRFISKVLRMRYDNNLPTAIATNLTPARFKISLCGISTKDKTVEDLKRILAELEKTNPILDRLIPIMKVIYIKGESHRG